MGIYIDWKSILRNNASGIRWPQINALAGIRISDFWTFG